MLALKGHVVIAVVVLYMCFTAVMFMNSHVMLHNPYPLVVSGSRIGLAGMLLLAVFGSLHRKKFIEYSKQLWCLPFVKYSLCLFTVAATCFSWSVQYLDPVKACFLLVMSPFVTALLVFMLHGEKLTYKKIAGLMIGFSAVVPIVMASDHGVFQEVPFALTVIGYAAFCCAILCFAYGWILKKELLSVVSHVPSPLITAWALTFGGAVTMVGAALAYQTSIVRLSYSSDFTTMLVWFAFGTAFSYALYGVLLKTYSATFLSFCGFLEPALGMVYGGLFFGHPITVKSLIALGVLGAGLFVFYQEELT